MMVDRRDEDPGFCATLFEQRRREGKPVEWWEVWNHDRASVIERFTNDSWLYVVRVQGTVGPLKIGRSVDAPRRIKSIQAPGPLEPLAMVPEWVCSEREAHERWAHLRQHGEWFTPNGQLTEWVAKLSLRWAALAPIRDRAMAVLAERATRRRPLGGLMAVEAQLREDALRRCGCALCGASGVVVTRCSALPGPYFCGSCANWIRESAKVGYEELRQRYQNAADFAAARLAQHTARMARIAVLRATA